MDRIIFYKHYTYVEYVSYQLDPSNIRLDTISDQGYSRFVAKFMHDNIFFSTHQEVFEIFHTIKMPFHYKVIMDNAIIPLH